ncbi:DUF2778 domain-containing protein [Mesorhizobium sp. 8]|uniref:DUF2778 domain-containing protein n=1 Tax=Mesorhizobium sp. 8 TaxID=2584466 RepID=UPI001122F2C4|nr:DUF2778 domain-containing protein [Mesorhizobium sp. 8]QDC00031.1 DUF2778 domain-containing protein [Mesorhizobium sp. 8]
MAFLRIDTAHHEPTGRTGRSFIKPEALLRWVTVPGAVAGLALWSLTTLSSAYTATAPAASATSFMPHLPPGAIVAQNGAAVQQGKAGRVAPVQVASAAAMNVSIFPRRTLNERFEKVASAADLSPKKLAKLFAGAGLSRAKAAHTPPARERFEAAHAVAEAGHAAPVSNRFGPGPAETVRASRLALALSGSSDIQLAYADPSPASAASAAFDAVLVAPQDDALQADTGEDRPLFSELPDSIAPPMARPRIAKPEAQAPERAVAEKPAEAAKPSVAEDTKPAKRSKSQQMLAFAKPDNPTERGGLAGAFSNLFSPKPKRPRAGVAIYDISAAKVYMPDGSVLEAHSGIGKMADNPRYANQKMRGPTPPDTYNLSMRESLFHGVQALRMTPTDGKVEFGRSGILAHSYLLRGGRAESHGCVAFKNYDKFLNAFKRGHIKQLVVVPGSRGRKAPATTVAQNGRGA